MKPALHRSLTFWSGILVMAFIGWAWRDSLRYESVCAFHSLRARNSYGACQINWTTNQNGSYPAPFRSPIIETERIPVPVFPSAVFLRGSGGSYEEWRDNIADYQSAGSYLDILKIGMRYSPHRDWAIILPHWLTLSVFAPAWLLLVAWQARRRKRTIERTAQAVQASLQDSP